jgi:hypothetical protein
LLNEALGPCSPTAGSHRRGGARFQRPSIDLYPPRGTSMKQPLPEPLTIPSLTKEPVQPRQPGISCSPYVSDDILRAIGAVAIAWAKLENSLNDLIWTIQEKDLQTGRIETQELQITKLLSTLQNTAKSHLIGDKFSNERRALDNIIKFVHATKQERNNVIHGSWGTLGNNPILGTLKADTPSLAFVTYEHYPEERLEEIKDYAGSAIKNVMDVIYRLESLRETPSPQPK